jgi:hypothetical protein
MLLIMSVHPRRHVEQIKAIRKGDRAYIEDNAAARQELAALIARLDARRFHCAVGFGWTVATLLCHLAFWDRLALSRLTEWESGQIETSRLGAQAIDGINEGVKAISQAVPGPAAARLALDSATAVDLRVEGIADELRARIVQAGFERILRRSLHRREHLRKIEEALG